MNAAPALTYDAAHQSWQRDPEGWWRDAAKLITWDRAPDRIFTPATGPYGAWFEGAALNISANCLDRHVAAGRGAQPALIWDSPMTGQVLSFTYTELLNRPFTARKISPLEFRVPFHEFLQF